MIVKTKVVDAIIMITVGNEQHLIHFEFQTDYESDIANRIFVYAGALTAKYDLNVTSILFQIKPPPKNAAAMNRYDINLFGMVIIPMLDINIKPACCRQPLSKPLL